MLLLHGGGRLAAPLRHGGAHCQHRRAGFAWQRHKHAVGLQQWLPRDQTVLSKGSPAAAASSSSSTTTTTTTADAAASGSAPGAAATQAASSVPGDEYFETDARPVILFDGVCNLCNGGVNFMLDWDQRGAFRLAALQSAAGRLLLQRAGRRPDDISSIVLVERDRAYIKSEAVLRIAQGLNMPLALLAGLAFLVPRQLSDAVYDQVADNRYRLLGYRDACRLSDARFEERFLTE